jgi:hypothetical protein
MSEKKNIFRYVFFNGSYDWIYILYDEIYDFWTAWARESSGLGIVIKKHFRKNVFFAGFFWFLKLFFDDLIYDFLMMF